MANPHSSRRRIRTRHFVDLVPQHAAELISIGQTADKNSIGIWDLQKSGTEPLASVPAGKVPGEVSRDFALNVSLVKSFHRMWMASAKA